MKNKVLRILLSIVFITLSGVSFANDNLPQDYPHNPSGSDDDAVASIDQTVIWLMMTGILVAIFVFRNRKEFLKS